MEFTAEQISSFIDGTVDGDINCAVSGFGKIEDAKSGDLAFLSNEKYTEYIYSTNASLVIVNDSFKPEQSLPKGLTLVRVKDARLAFTKLLDVYVQNQPRKTGVDKQVSISDSATIGKDVYIGSYTYIGDNATIGDNVSIAPGCYVGDNCVIGNNTIMKEGVRILNESKIGSDCTFQPNAVIGGDGFGFAPNSENNYQKIPHTGNVIIEDHVEIGSNTTVDRATIGSTIIKKGVKLDNLIQVAHNVEIGDNTVIAAQTGIAGSTKIGKNCMIGGQVGIVGHLTIADEVKIAAQSGIGHSIPNVGEIMQGSPAFSIGDYKRSYVLFRRLPDLNNKIKELFALINK